MALLAVAALALSACGSNRTVPGDTVTVTKTAGAIANPGSATPTPSHSASASPSKPKPKPKPKTVVHVSSLLSDGETYGVGMPIVLFFSPVPSSAAAFDKAVKVTVNGTAAPGAWYWEQPLASEKASHTIEAHFRMQNYWPAHSHIHVSFPIKGLSAGKNKVFSGALSSLDFHIGDAHISYVVNHGEHAAMTVTSDGHVVKTMQASLGAAETPTYNGTKVVMQKGEDIPGTDTLRPEGAVRMIGPGYDEIVNWSVRLTQSGEYAHAAPWNTHLGELNTSNGCTNLSVADGEWFYNFSLVGDVVKYSGTDGTTMPVWDGFGDWNLSWPEWDQGGQLINHNA